MKWRGGSANAQQQPDSPMTSEQADALRFPMSQPHGYHPASVDRAMEQIVHSLRSWEDLVFRWQQHAHELQTQLDQARSDNLRLRTEIQVFAVNGSPTLAEDGTYLRESHTHTP